MNSSSEWSKKKVCARKTVKFTEYGTGQIWTNCTRSSPSHPLRRAEPCTRYPWIGRDEAADTLLRRAEPCTRVGSDIVAERADDGVEACGGARPRQLTQELLPPPRGCSIPDRCAGIFLPFSACYLVGIGRWRRCLRRVWGEGATALGLYRGVTEIGEGRTCACRLDPRWRLEGAHLFRL